MHSTSVDALKRLAQGNDRFVSGIRTNPPFCSLKVLSDLTTRTQSPFSIVLTCSDSRLSTELLFDCDLGELFVVRVAGAVISRSILASIEYAAQNLTPTLCVVMGHTDCGAMKAAVQFSGNRSAGLTPNLRHLINKLEPSVAQAKEKKSAQHDGHLHNKVALEHVRRTVSSVRKKSPVLKRLSKHGSFQIVGALCDVATGRVFFDLKEPHQIISRKNDAPLLKQFG